MGSALTEDALAMRVVGKVLATRDLLFLDSLTTGNSVALRAMSGLGIRLYRRDVFLDNEPDYAYMKGMWDEFLGKARTQGSAILIAHDRVDSIYFLRRRLPDLAAEGIMLLPLSGLASRPPGV